LALKAIPVHRDSKAIKAIKAIMERKVHQDALAHMVIAAHKAQLALLVKKANKAKEDHRVPRDLQDLLVLEEQLVKKASKDAEAYKA